MDNVKSTHPAELSSHIQNNEAYHCCFSDGPKTVDKNVAGYIYRRTWKEEREEKENKS